MTSVSVWLTNSKPCGLELDAQSRVVLDDAVVHEGDRDAVPPVRPDGDGRCDRWPARESPNACG